MAKLFNKSFFENQKTSPFLSCFLKDKLILLNAFKSYIIGLANLFDMD